MKITNNFAAQQLSKKQMIAIKGGDIECYVRYKDVNGDYFDEKGIVGGANTLGEAAQLVSQKYTSIGFEMTAIKCD